MKYVSRREFLALGALAAGVRRFPAAEAADTNVYEQIMALAQRQQEERRRRFAAVASRNELEGLQRSLRQKFINLLDGLPDRQGPPPARTFGRIEGDDYIVEKIAFESMPAYFVPALLYRPKRSDGKRPGIISPCGHAAVGKASPAYQILHINLVKRGYIVLTYDPVGQGERSQFWDAGRGRSRYNLVCGEHAVLGNPLYLLGTSLARYRIHDGIRAIDHLAALPEVDAEKIGCVGNSGGGTLTAYISALDPRVKVSVPSCYITTLPRRMGNRIERDPDSDPEQDIFGFVSEGIDHAGLLALMVPRPTLVNAARLDFFPIEGTRESVAEVRRLYEVAGAGERIAMTEADERHGLSLPLRQAAYGWFDRWLASRQPQDIRSTEIMVTPRSAKELQVTDEGQVNPGLRSRHLLPLALELFDKQPARQRIPLRQLLAPDEPARCVFRTLAIGNVPVRPESTLIVCINGNEAPPWQDEREFLDALCRQQLPVQIVDPRGVGVLRPRIEIKGRDHADPLAGVEANIAYNAFLAGQSLIGMRVGDVLAALAELRSKLRFGRVLLCGRRDAALVACFAAALDGGGAMLAVEEMLPSYRLLFDPAGRPINAASIAPALLRNHGDIPDVLQSISPRKMLLAASRGTVDRRPDSAQLTGDRFTTSASILLEWLRR
jgi:dienelactone hydrolase